MKLSILIPTLKKRRESFEKTISELSIQIMDCEAFGEVEILSECDEGQMTTGEKRNKLIERCKGKYFVFFDDDDQPLKDYLYLILKAIESDPDVIPINGYMTTNGTHPVGWDMGLGYSYRARSEGGVVFYERFPNHIAPMKKELVKDFKFLHVTRGEDYDWALRIHNAGVLKTEYRITDHIYHYKFIENK